MPGQYCARRFPGCLPARLPRGRPEPPTHATTPAWGASAWRLLKASPCLPACLPPGPLPAVAADEVPDVRRIVDWEYYRWVLWPSLCFG